MKSKKTSQLHRSVFILISCFMITWQASAQTFSNARTGTSYDGYVINNNNSNYWTYLRLQTSNKAWNISNENGLNWRYSPNNNHGDQGVTKMKLTTGGDLGLGLGTSNPVSRLHLRQAINDFNGGIKIVNSAQGRQFNLYVDGSNDSRINSGSTGTGELILNSGGGKVGIGTTTPSTTLHVAGTGHFSGNVGIGTTTPSAALDVVGIAHFGDDVGIGTTTPRGMLDVDGPGDIYLVDDPDNSSAPQAIFLPGDMRITPHGSNIAYVQARRGNSSGSTEMRFRTYDNGVVNEAMHIDDEGNVGIDTTAPTEKLEVNGTVKATSFTSAAGSFPDYVFAADYKITPLSELEAYVKRHNRLPNMPSEQEVVEKGLNIPEVTIKSVENIETIYLHLIRMEKEIKALQQENATLKQQLKKGR